MREFVSWIRFMEPGLWMRSTDMMRESPLVVGGLESKGEMGVTWLRVRDRALPSVWRVWMWVN